MYTVDSPELKLRLLWLAIGYALVVLVIYLSLTSTPIEMGVYFSFEDKLYHALAYFTLMAWFSQIYHSHKQRIILVVVFVLMGLSLELLQSLNPNRFAEYGDMAANTAGAALGFVVTLSGVKNTLLRLEELILKN